MKNLFKNKFYKIIVLLLLIIFFIWIYFKKNDFKEYFENKLYVGNLPYSVRDGDLEQAFGDFGSVTSAKVMIDRDTGKSKGFGFVEMRTDAEAQAAIAGMNGQALGGRSLVVNEAQPMESKPLRSGGGGGGYGGGGGRIIGAGGTSVFSNYISEKKRIVCPSETPKWDIKSEKCISCTSTAPKWDIKSQECVPCPSETPNWDISSTPPKCTPCPTTKPKWDIKSQKCVPCPTTTPKWDINSQECVQCPSETPNWDISSTPPKCISCPSREPKWDTTLKPYPKCVPCPKHTPIWNPITQKCNIKIHHQNQ